MAGGTSAVPSNDFEHEPWSQEKDFGLRKNTSKQVPGEVCLDRADVVIDGMWLIDEGPRIRQSGSLQ